MCNFHGLNEETQKNGTRMLNSICARTMKGLNAGIFIIAGPNLDMRGGRIYYTGGLFPKP